MKQIILILGFFVVTNLFGQKFNKIDYQIDLGATVSIPYKMTIELWPEFDGHPETDYSSRLGYFFEFMISYKINSKFVINPGLNYNYTKLKINNKVGFIESKGNLTNSYINFPILVKYRLSDNIPFSVSAGPYLGLLISAKEKGTSYFDTAKLVYAEPDPIIQSIDAVQKYHNDIKKDYAAFDFGLSAQFDYELKLSGKFIGMIFTRFNYGLKDVMTNDLVNNNVASVWKNYNLLIGLGIKL